MNRIDKTFKKLTENGEKAFIPFFVVGDPNPEIFIRMIREIEPFADIIELGIPFTDPVADGPVIQEANKRAFGSGMNLSKAFDLIQEIRTFTDKPIVILTYANVIGVGERMQKTISRFSDVGVDGIIIADIPLEEADPVLSVLEKHNIYKIFIAAPTTTQERLKMILDRAKGFLYVVAVKGVTGSREQVQTETKETIQNIARIVESYKPIPICVGFGISKPEHIKNIISYGADGAIVGSAIIKKIESNVANPQWMLEKVKIFIQNMKFATKMDGL